MRTVTRKEMVEINNWVKVSAIYYNDLTAECAVLTRTGSKWEIDEEEVPAKDNMSYMEVYGYIEHLVKPAYTA